MRLIGKERLVARHVGAVARTWLISWVSEISMANWKGPMDVVRQFPKARQESDSQFIFPVEDDIGEIDVLIAFPQGIALVTDLKVRG